MKLEEWVVEEVIRALKEQRVVVKSAQELQELEDYATDVATTLFRKIFQEEFDAEVFRRAFRSRVKDLSVQTF